MFLINDLTILEESNKENGILDISPLEPDNLEPTYYYFRLGKYIYRWNKTDEKWMPDDLSLPGNEIVTIDKNEYILVQTFERFRCSKQVFASFGHTSRLFRKGLTIRNSPFIDPNFPDSKGDGFLEIGIKNELDQKVKIKYQDIIGKISFFNVSDTYPISDLKGFKSKQDYQRRKGIGGQIPLYDDHPVHGYEEVEEYGRKNRKRQ